MKTIPIESYNIKLMPSLPRNEPFVMDSTAAKLLMECRRKYFYRIVLGRVLPSDRNQIFLDWGSAYHKFREILELTQSYLKAMEFVMNVELPVVTGKYEFLNKKRFIETCIKAYEHWKDEKSKNKIEVIAIEQPFNVQIVDDLFIGGRADQIIKFQGRLWGRDFKTTTKDKAVFTKQIDPNDQAMRYIMGESAIHGREIQGIMFEAMYNAKTLKPQIYTINTTRSPYQKQTWLSEQKLMSRQLKIYREEDIWPMDTCGRCDWCEYHQVCRLSNMPSQEQVLRSSYSHKIWDHTQVDQVTEVSI